MWSEPKDEPTETSMQSSELFLSWLLRQELIGQIVVVELDLGDSTNYRTQPRSQAISPMKSESKRIIQTIERKAINPITDKPMFRTSDEVLEEALEVFYQHLKGKKVV